MQSLYGGGKREPTDDGSSAAKLARVGHVFEHADELSSAGLAGPVVINIQASGSNPGRDGFAGLLSEVMPPAGMPARGPSPQGVSMAPLLGTPGGIPTAGWAQMGPSIPANREASDENGDITSFVSSQGFYQTDLQNANLGMLTQQTRVGMFLCRFDTKQLLSTEAAKMIWSPGMYGSSTVSEASYEVVLGVPWINWVCRENHRIAVARMMSGNYGNLITAEESRALLSYFPTEATLAAYDQLRSSSNADPTAIRGDIPASAPLADRERQLALEGAYRLSRCLPFAYLWGFRVAQMWRPLGLCMHAERVPHPQSSFHEAPHNQVNFVWREGGRQHQTYCMWTCTSDNRAPTEQNSLTALSKLFLVVKRTKDEHAGGDIPIKFSNAVKHFPQLHPFAFVPVATRSQAPGLCMREYVDFQPGNCQGGGAVESPSTYNMPNIHVGTASDVRGAEITNHEAIRKNCGLEDVRAEDILNTQNPHIVVVVSRNRKF